MKCFDISKTNCVIPSSSLQILIYILSKRTCIALFIYIGKYIHIIFDKKHNKQP